MREIAFSVALTGDPVVEFLRKREGSHSSYSISVSGDVAWQVNVFRGDARSVEAFVRDVAPDPGPLQVTTKVIQRGREEVAYFMTWRRPPEGAAVSIPHLVLDAIGPAFLLFSETTAAGRDYRLYVAEATDLRPLHRALRSALGTGARVAAVRPSALPGRGVELTPLQERVLREAVSAGYYEMPHRLGLAQLAKRLGLPVSTVAYNLRRAESAVIMERHRQKYPRG
ncbi:MAG TPA: helix-turn-helix domain-containing protein [Thermoplasmata archaeon]|nr:helix-turn-helix domain-containing protein [Thermoplasmata archaeon]